ncbi:hypothetical protein [Hyphomonas sp.]|uniref:hypothetical protein n=1 Tax=Hyphomonas sp. TaxID=87 RepID=UPI0030010BB5
MKFTRPMAAISCFLLVIVGTALPAAAADWTAWEGHNATAPLAVHATDTNNHGVLLTCGSNGKVAAMVSLSPGDMPDLLSKNAPYNRSAKATISVGNGEEVTTTVQYIPAINTIEARTPAIAAKVFNAAVLGEPISISLERKSEIVSALPAPNDTFKAFANTCKKLRERSTQ